MKDVVENEVMKELIITKEDFKKYFDESKIITKEKYENYINFKRKN
jgi:hypothetical protein|nr:MAG TPA: hypothetical protein [Caudoviricetes sp.]